jgi:hypothetical protein
VQCAARLHAESAGGADAGDRHREIGADLRVRGRRVGHQHGQQSAAALVEPGERRTQRVLPLDGEQAFVDAVRTGVQSGVDGQRWGRAEILDGSGGRLRAPHVTRIPDVFWAWTACGRSSARTGALIPTPFGERSAGTGATGSTVDSTARAPCGGPPAGTTSPTGSSSPTRPPPSRPDTGRAQSACPRSTAAGGRVPDSALTGGTREVGTILVAHALTTRTDLRHRTKAVARSVGADLVA